MKTITKATLMCLALLFTFSVTSGQGLKGKPKEEKEKQKNNTSSDSKEHCYDENTHIINLGAGFGGGYYTGGRYGAYSYRSSPAISLSYEQPLKKKLGPGYLGVGAYFGYQSARYRYDDVYHKGNRYYYEHHWNHIMIAARGAYHWDVLNFKTAEVYAGAIVGMRIQTYRYETNNPDPDAYYYRLNDGAVYPSYSVFAGARWYFVPKVALFGEAGYGISYLTGGFSFKF